MDDEFEVRKGEGIQALQERSLEFWRQYRIVDKGLGRVTSQVLSVQDVMERIEVVVFELVGQINMTGTISLSFFSSSKSASFNPVTNTNRLSNIVTTTLNSQKALKSISHILKVLEISYSLLQSNRKASKREIFYSSPALFKLQKASDKAIDYACCLLEVPRDRLNILASSKGLVAGGISYLEQGKVTEVGSRTVKIPADLDTVSEISVQAEFILVVEKDTVLSRLLQEGFFDWVKCIGVTGCGYPDLPTRQFIRRLVNEFPFLPVLILTDFDPHGFQILCTYTFGSVHLALESDYLSLPFSHWLGVNEIGLEPLPLSPCDRKLLSKLLNLESISRPPSCYQSKRFNLWRVHLKQMKKLDCKYEIDSIPNISEYIVNKINCESWI